MLAIDAADRPTPGRGLLSAVASLAPRCGPIGLEFSHERLYLIQFEYRGGVPHVRAALSQRYPVAREELLANAPGLRRFLRQALARAPFRGRRVVTCLPPAEVRLSLVSYSLDSGGSEARQVMKHALEGVDGSPGDWVVDYLPVYNGTADGPERCALVARARRTPVIEYLDLLRAAGLDVEALEIGPLAVQRLITAVTDVNAERVAITINFGTEQSFITVFSAGRLTLERELPFGESKLVDRVARALDIDRREARTLAYHHGIGETGDGSGAGAGPETDVGRTLAEILKPSLAELAAEIERAVVYTASKLRGAGVDAVYLLGSVARWPGAERTLDRLLSLPVRVLDPIATFAVCGRRAIVDDLDPVAGIAVATGCALRGRPDG